jgi:hypothetical protein
LISISKVYNVDYVFFYENIFSILKNKNFIGGGTLINGLYRIDLNPTFELNYVSIHVDFGIKRSKIDEDSSMLWNTKLGHISIERIKRLVNYEVLNTFNFTDFSTCVNYIKGNQTNKTTKGVTRNLEILKIIYIELCRLFNTLCLNGQGYYISFINHQSRFIYLSLT